MGYRQLYIADRRTDDIYIEDALRDETRNTVHSQSLRMLHMLQQSGTNTVVRILTNENGEDSGRPEQNRFTQPSSHHD
jgi:hypothetical protein